MPYSYDVDLDEGRVRLVDESTGCTITLEDDEAEDFLKLIGDYDFDGNHDEDKLEDFAPAYFDM